MKVCSMCRYDGSLFDAGDDPMCSDCRHAFDHGAEKAEAEVKRLRAALEKIGASTGYYAAVANQALRGDAS